MGKNKYFTEFQKAVVTYISSLEDRNEALESGKNIDRAEIMVDATRGELIIAYKNLEENCGISDKERESYKNGLIKLVTEREGNAPAESLKARLN